MLAVGDATGRILLWHGVLAALTSGQPVGINSELECSEVHAAEQIRTQATVHWHAEPVCCMAFSPDGAYLLSGEVVQAMQGSVHAALHITSALPPDHAHMDASKLTQGDMKVCSWSGTFPMAGEPICLV